MRIGFLFNHDALHQVRHTAPVAAALAGRSGVAVEVLVSSAEQEREVRAVVGPDAAARIRFVALGIGPLACVLDAGLRRVLPFRRIATLRENLAAFAELDVLVVPESTSLLLRRWLGADAPKLVWIPHGAGDRSIGFRAETRRFDLVLLSGEKVRERMAAEGLIREGAYAVVGYPKFDTVAFDRPAQPLFADDRPTVLYNPHFDPRLSSWYDWGRPIMSWFARQQRFDLVVAPHVMLFRRRWHASVEHRGIRLRRDVPAGIEASPNILIDRGSERSIDMSYTRAADIYLGDASSQIYEWIARPRPAIFLNPRGIAWRGDPDFAHWELGEVVDRIEDLPAALDRAVADPNRYAERQRAAFVRTFGVADRHAAERAADAILAHLAPGERQHM